MRSVLKKKLVLPVGLPLGIVLLALIGITLLGFYNPNKPATIATTSDASAAPVESTPAPAATPSAPALTPPTSPTPSTRDYSPPQLPAVTEDSTLAWYDQHSSTFDQFSLYAQQIDSAIGGCSTTNPDYNSMCVDYDGSTVLPVCTALLDEVTTGKSFGPIAYAPANTQWQNALSSFADAAQTCIAKINAHQYVGEGTDVGFTIKPALLTGVNDLTATVSAITNYQQTL